MTTSTVLRPSQNAALAVYRFAFGCYPEVDEHEFATAYVKYVEKTGEKPDVFDAIHNFSRFGVVV